VRASRSLKPSSFGGVGAAFDFPKGVLHKRPAWMGNHGLEWFYSGLRFEPRRLVAPLMFMSGICGACRLELTGSKKARVGGVAVFSRSGKNVNTLRFAVSAV